MNAILSIKNSGQEVASTNFWETGHARRGHFLVSVNAGAFRILVPTIMEDSLDEMRGATGAALSRGPFRGPTPRTPPRVDGPTGAG